MKLYQLRRLKLTKTVDQKGFHSLVDENRSDILRFIQKQITRID